MQLKSLIWTLVWINACTSLSSAEYHLPDDVEVFDDTSSPSFWFGPRARRHFQEQENPLLDGFVKAIRNRRALSYHIKTVPHVGEPYEGDHGDGLMYENMPSRFIKRDIEKLPDMDVSAQYTEQFDIDHVNTRKRREIIEEEDIKNGNQKEELVETSQVWIPQTSIDDDDDIFDKKKEAVKPEKKPVETVAIAEALTDNINGREARGVTKDQWIKLPFLPRSLENEQLSSARSASEEVSHRMPRVNFVTQGKGLQAAESRNQRESSPRESYSRSSDLRTDIYPPEKDSRARSLDYSSYARRGSYYPDDYYRRPYEDDYYDDSYYYTSRRDPYYDRYDYKNGRRYENDYSRYDRDNYDRYDGYDDYYRSDKPRRVIYYANLPDVVRTPPNVYRYHSTPTSRYDDDRYYRDYRNDNYRRGYANSRYPYSPLKKSENEVPRDLSNSINKDKTTDNQKRQEQIRKGKEDSRARDSSLNSHQYPVGMSSNVNSDGNSKGPHQTLYHDITRMDSDFHRYDYPSFQAAVDDPYVSRHD